MKLLKWTLYLFILFSWRLLSAQSTSSFNADILLLGDSITYLWGGSESQTSSGHPGGAFNAPWKENFGEYKTLNAGIKGDRIEHVLWRLEHGTLDHISPKVVVLAIGTNNIQSIASNAVPVAAVAQGIKLCVDSIRYRSPQSQVLIVKILPRDTPDKPAYQDALKVNKALDDLKLTDIPGVYLLDLWQDFLNPDGTLIKEYYTDGLHLLVPGYAVWAKKMKPVLDPLLKNEFKAASQKPEPPLYPYTAYNERKMDPQLTGWPLTTEEAQFVSKKKEFDRKPGDHAMWPVTPTANYWRECPGFNPWVEVIHANILNEIRVAVGNPAPALPAPTDLIPNPDETLILATGQTLASGESKSSPNGTFQLTNQSDGVLTVTTGGKTVWTSERALKEVKTPATLEMLSDGNLALFINKDVNHKAQWASGSYQGGEKALYFCTLSNEGQLKIYKDSPSKGSVIWRSPKAE